MFITRTRTIIRSILLALFFLILGQYTSSAAEKFEDAEKHLINFETYFLKNESRKAVAEFEKFSEALSAGNVETANGDYNDIRAVYSAFINYVSSFRSSENAVAAEKTRKPKNSLFTVFSRKYEELLKKQRLIAQTKEKNGDPISYFEELNKYEENEKYDDRNDPALISAEFESAIKDAALIRFISGRPLFLFMLYKNIKEAGNDFQASFLKSLISKNVSADILASSDFPEFAGAGREIPKSDCAVFDASLMTSFGCAANKISSSALLRAALKNKTLKKADLSKAAALKIVFSKYCFYFDIVAAAGIKFSNETTDSIFIEFQKGMKIKIKPKKFEGIFAETAFLKNCRKIKYSGMDFYSSPETGNKTFLMSAGSDFLEIVFINFDSDVEAQTILNSFKTL